MNRQWAEGMGKVNLNRRELLTYFTKLFSSIMLLRLGFDSAQVKLPETKNEVFRLLSMWLCGFKELDERLVIAYKTDLMKSFSKKRVVQCLTDFERLIVEKYQDKLNAQQMSQFMLNHQPLCQALLTLWYTGQLQHADNNVSLRAYAYTNALQWKVAGVTAQSVPGTAWHLPL